jgi:hypothetical protein
MGELRKVLLEASKEKEEKERKEGKMLKKLHVLDDVIEEFIDGLEDEIMGVEGNPVFVKKAHQLLADMSKEYSEFMMALRSIVNAVDRKEKILPAFEKGESKVRDILDGAEKNGSDEDGEEIPEEEMEDEGDEGDEDDGDSEFELKVAKKKGKSKKLKEALEISINESSEEDVAFKEMTIWLKNMKQKMMKTESSIKKKTIDMNVTDTFMRLSKVDEESFFNYFWG